MKSPSAPLIYPLIVYTLPSSDPLLTAFPPHNIPNYRRDGDRTIIYSCSVDGSIALCEELAGRLSCRFLLDQCFGHRVGVQFCELASGVRAIVAASSKAYWGVWDDASLRKIIVVREKGVVNAVRTVCYSRDQEDLRELKEELASMSAIQVRLTTYLAVIYTLQHPF